MRLTVYQSVPSSAVLVLRDEAVGLLWILDKKDGPPVEGELESPIGGAVTSSKEGNIDVQGPRLFNSEQNTEERRNTNPKDNANRHLDGKQITR